MSKEHLIDISTRPDFKEITARGGRAKSAKKTRANQLKGVKRMTPENLEKKGLDIVRNPEMSALQIIDVIQELLSRDLQPRTKVELLGKMVQAHTAIHGAYQKNINLNIDMTSDKIINRLKAWKEKENETRVTNT